MLDEFASVFRSWTNIKKKKISEGKIQNTIECETFTQIRNRLKGNVERIDSEGFGVKTRTFLNVKPTRDAERPRKSMRMRQYQSIMNVTHRLCSEIDFVLILFYFYACNGSNSNDNYNSTINLCICFWIQLLT